MAGKKEGAKLLSPKARLCFHSLFKPKQVLGKGDLVYTACLVFDPEAQKTEAFGNLVKAAQAAAISRFGEKAKTLPLKTPFRPVTEKPEWFEGKFDPKSVFINVKSIYQPLLLDRARQEIINERDLYSGCYVRGLLNAYAYDKLGNKGVSFGLGGIQFLEPGEPLGAMARPDDFDPLPDEDEAQAQAAASPATGKKEDVQSLFR